MSVPPLLLDLKVASSARRPVRLWLPLFLLWPPALVLGVIALAVALAVDAAAFLAGRRHHRAALLARSLETLCEARGTVIRFNNAKTAVDMTVR